MAKKLIKIAIAYDFDGTLAKGNIQENSFIPELGLTKKKFWAEANEIGKKSEMDKILAYMYLLIKKAKEDGNVKFDKKSLIAHGKNVRFFKGVESYFKRINAYSKRREITLEHYIISSGTKEMILGSTIAKEFKHIYASSFKFDQNGIPEWPAQAINYTTKTQFLFRINKGVKNLWEDSRINEFTAENDRPIPFKNMIYIGDGLTDVPSMKLVKSQGGFSIGVYEPRAKLKSKVEKLLTDNRANYVAPADYSHGSDLDTILKAIINHIASRESIAKFSKIK